MVAFDFELMVAMLMWNMDRFRFRKPKKLILRFVDGFSVADGVCPCYVIVVGGLSSDL